MERPYNIVTFSQLRNKLEEIEKQAELLSVSFYMKYYEELLLILLNQSRMRRGEDVVPAKVVAALGYHSKLGTSVMDPVPEVKKPSRKRRRKSVASAASTASDSSVGASCASNATRKAE